MRQVTTQRCELSGSKTIFHAVNKWCVWTAEMIRFCISMVLLRPGLKGALLREISSERAFTIRFFKMSHSERERFANQRSKFLCSRPERSFSSKFSPRKQKQNYFASHSLNQQLTFADIRNAKALVTSTWSSLAKLNLKLKRLLFQGVTAFLSTPFINIVTNYVKHTPVIPSGQQLQYTDCG